MIIMLWCKLPGARLDYPRGPPCLCLQWGPPGWRRRRPWPQANARDSALYICLRWSVHVSGSVVHNVCMWGSVCLLSWFTTLSAFLVQLSGVLVYLSAVWVDFVWILSLATPHGGFTKLAVTHEPKKFENWFFHQTSYKNVLFWLKR